MKTRSIIAKLASASLLLVAATPAPAQSAGTYAYNFLKEAGCQLLPFAACDVLDQDNAINLFRANQIMFMNNYCGTGYINGAKTALDTGMANDELRCRQVLQAMGVIR